MQSYTVEQALEMSDPARIKLLSARFQEVPVISF
jgi:hypothetical protein